MSVWTISAQPGTRGVEVAAELAARAGVPLFDRKALEPAHADHVERAWVRALFDVRVDDPALYTVVLDASRLAPDSIVEVLLAAGGRK